MSPERTRTGRAILAHPILTMFVSLVIVIGVPVGVALWVGHDKDVKLEAQQQAFVDYQVADKVTSCEGSNRGRKALQKVLDDAANPPPAGAALVDFSELDGFDALDGNTQFFLNNLEVRLNAPGGDSNLRKIADDYRTTNPSDVDCQAEGRELRHTLED